MNGARVQVVGRERVEAELQGLKRGTSSVQVPSEKLVEVGLRATSSVVPVATGLLSSSIEGHADEKTASLEVRLEYAPYQEFGTRYVAGRRFMRAGFEAMSSSARDVYTGWLDDQLAATGGKTG